MAGIWYGLASALGYGVADFLAAGVSRRIGNLRTVFWMYTWGLVAATAVLALPAGRSLPGTAGIGWWLAAAGAAACQVAATALLYRAFQVGVLALVSPIAASYGAVGALLALLFGERPGPLELAGLVLTAGGVLLAAAAPWPKGAPSRPRRWGASPGVGAAVGTALLAGVAMWGMGQVAPVLGPIWPVWLTRLLGVATLGAAAGRAGFSRALPARAEAGRVALVSLLDTTALMAYNLGTTLALVAVVSVLGSLFSAVTVVLAYVFLGERPVPHQWLGIALILAGVALVSA